MDVVIICPPGSTSDRLFTMCEAGGIASVLDGVGSKPIIVDGHQFKQREGLNRSITGQDPDLAVFVIQWYYQITMSWISDVMSYLRSIFPHVHVCAIGRASTIYHQILLQRLPDLDSVVLGEAEETIVELVNLLQDEKEAWRNVEGIAFGGRGIVIKTQPRRAIGNLDNLPFAMRNYLNDRNAYPVAPLYTSRSCYGNCTFCLGKVFRESTFCSSTRMRSAQNVCDEIEMLVQNYGSHIFYFVDDNFFGDGGKVGRDRARMIAEEILYRSLRIRFYIECRVNDVDFELFKLLKQAGLRKVFLGIESGAQQFLDRHRKGTTVAQNREAVYNLRNLGINCDPGFIFWDPWITFDELCENTRFIREMALHKCHAQVPLLSNRLNIHPGMDMERLNISPELVPGVGREYEIINPQVRAIDKVFRSYKAKVVQQLRSSNIFRVGQENGVSSQSFRNIQGSELDLCVMEALIEFFESDSCPGEERIEEAGKEVQRVVTEYVQKDG